VNVYVASSWRNERQPAVVGALRKGGHKVYDFRHPTPEDTGFSWSEIDRNWQSWTVDEYIAALNHPAAEWGFSRDMRALDECDACVLVLPCGRSAHLELGYAIGRGKHGIILLDRCEPELMSKMARLCRSMDEVLAALAAIKAEREDAP
jgi:nucleoside 2-deoxyribosyltransferase